HTTQIYTLSLHDALPISPIAKATITAAFVTSFALIRNHLWTIKVQLTREMFDPPCGCPVHQMNFEVTLALQLSIDTNRYVVTQCIRNWTALVGLLSSLFKTRLI